MLKENFLKKKLNDGKPVIGTWSIIPSTVTTDIISSTGIDFIIIDTEHGPINFETAQNMVIACESRDVSPVMRVGGIIEDQILRALDIGVHAIQIPNVKSESDVKSIINLSKYPPIGNRGFSPFTRAGNYSIESSQILTQTANENTLVSINVEGTDAIENIDSILNFKSLDIVFVGLFDLSKAMGMPGKVKDIKVLKNLEFLTGKINKSNKFTGTIATSEEDLERFIGMGIKYILYLVDCELLRDSYSKIVKKFKTFSK